MGFLWQKIEKPNIRHPVRYFAQVLAYSRS
ncbi:COX aromatic rich motif-containing protein [Pseudomonas schmalbachii]|uniref:COX aromatic rich motif-containing protein n=1 Tax=Pseudomonas schmalbachii TaxID=2816993 RepID=A0ABS3TUM7_9PSED|nr:COX aromatic rich motif-containing protein [Pseudomonas schmalbachii]